MTTDSDNRKTLFLQAPSFEGFDGGAGSRYQAKREIKSFWYPTWLAQPAALVANSRLLDLPENRGTLASFVQWDLIADRSTIEARHYNEFVISGGLTYQW